MTVDRRQTRRTAQVTIETLPRTISEDEQWLLENSGSVVTSERVSTEDGGVLVQHTTPGRVLMWKPGADGVYTPRVVSESSKGINLKNGWKSKCPDCDTNHEQSPYPPQDPNSCPAREPLAFRTCPSCGKRILDNMITNQFKADENAPDAGAAIKDENTQSTPESRTRVQLDRHLWAFHPRTAEAMGRPPLPVSRQYDGNLRPV